MQEATMPTLMLMLQVLCRVVAMRNDSMVSINDDDNADANAESGEETRRCGAGYVLKENDDDEEQLSRSFQWKRNRETKTERRSRGGRVGVSGHALLRRAGCARQAAKGQR
ncbi:hypothetical protein BKA80DRAFT_284965 [Phyllosticta citrichinensis]